MFDIGWSEMAFVLLVALIVIGPKDLPRVARTVGQWVGKGRAMAREFQRALEDMAREAELDKVKSEIEKAGRTNISKTIEKTIDPSGELGKAFDPKADSKEAGGDKRASGNRPAGAAAQVAQAASSPATPAKPESRTPAGNGAGVAAERKAPARESAPAAPVKRTRDSAPAATPAKRKRRARAGNGAGAAEDTKEPAPETAPAEPN